MKENNLLQDYLLILLTGITISKKQTLFTTTVNSLVSLDKCSENYGIKFIEEKIETEDWKEWSNFINELENERLANEKNISQLLSDKKRERNQKKK